MAYTIYKFVTPYNNFLVGDDIISDGYPYTPTNGSAPVVDGEAYGGGYRGERVEVPYSALAIVASNIDFSSLADYINYGSLPLPESSATYMQNGYMPACQPTTPVMQQTSAMPAPSSSKSSMGTIILVAVGAGVLYGVYRMSKRAA